MKTTVISGIPGNVIKWNDYNLYKNLLRVLEEKTRN